MEKKITINKQQLIASLATVSYMLQETDNAVLSELIQNFNKGIGPQLKESWKTDVILTEYENVKYAGVEK